MIYAYSDGSSIGNPGPGGYGVVLCYKGHRKEINQGYNLTTNNRMELLGAIKALEFLKKKETVVLTTDSRYVVDGINLGWAKKWKENGWMRTKKERAMNVDLWVRFLEQIDRHDVRIIWTRGHSGNIENERCDALANTAAKETDLIEDIGYETAGK